MNSSLILNDFSNATVFPSRHLPKLPLTLCIAVSLAISFLGVMSNSTLAFVIFGEPNNLRKKCNFLIGHSLLAYIGLCSVFLPASFIMLYLKQFHDYTVTSLTCQPLIWLYMAFRYAPTWIDTLLAINRLVAICIPIYYRTFCEDRFNKMAVLSIWILSGLWSVLGFFKLGITYIPGPFGGCTYYTYPNALGYVVTSVGYYIPLGISAVCYVLVYIKLAAIKMRKVTAVTSDAARTTAIRHERWMMANLLFVTFLWSTFCFFIFTVLMKVLPVEQTMSLLWAATVNIIGYALKPVLLCAMSRDYRSGLRKLVGLLPTTVAAYPIDSLKYQFSLSKRT